jgi:hypothetical protein
MTLTLDLASEPVGDWARLESGANVLVPRLVIETARTPPFSLVWRSKMTLNFDIKSGKDEFGETVYPGDRVVALTKSWGYPSLYKGTFLGINQTTIARWGRTQKINRYIVEDDNRKIHYLRANRVVKI